MSAAHELESALTDSYQTATPEAVRYALKLGERDKTLDAILPDGDDPLLGEFLSFLSRDMANHPEQIRMLDASLKARMDGLTPRLAPNLDQALSPDDE